MPMRFEKNNKLGAKKILKAELDAQPICFKGRKGQREKIKTVPDWPQRLRDFVDQLIEDLDKQ
jgi:hypothetical protein